MSQLTCLTGQQLVYLAATAASTIAEGLDTNDINILSNFFNAVGDSLGIIAARQAACERPEPDLEFGR